jgi:beta-lactamase class A
MPAVHPSPSVRAPAFSVAAAFLVSLAVLLGGAPLATSAQTWTVPSDDPDLARLVREIERLEPISGGTIGVAAVHLETGRAVYVNADEPFPMASTYKVPIAVQLLTRVDRGEIALSDMIEIQAGDLHPGSGTLAHLFDDPGVVLSLRNLMELMLLISDNSATDLTLEAAGGGDAVTARMEALGVEGIRVDRPTSLLIADYVGVEGVSPDGQVTPDEWDELADDLDETVRSDAAASFARDPRDTATPHGMADLLEMIWKGKAVSEESTELLLDVLRRVETGTARIKGSLPPETTVAHKTGTIGGTTNDVGIIYLPDDAGHVVTVVFVKDSEEPTSDRERAIAHVSRAIYDYFLFRPEA